MAGAFQLLSLKPYVSHLSCPCKTQTWALHIPLCWWCVVFVFYFLAILSFHIFFIEWMSISTWHLPASHCLKVIFLAFFLSLKIDQPFLYCLLQPSSLSLSILKQTQHSVLTHTVSKPCAFKVLRRLLIFPPSSDHGRRTLYLMKAHHEHPCCIITPSQVYLSILYCLNTAVLLLYNVLLASVFPIKLWLPWGQKPHHFYCFFLLPELITTDNFQV